MGQGNANQVFVVKNWHAVLTLVLWLFTAVVSYATLRSHRKQSGSGGRKTEMKIGDYEVTITPLGWIALAAIAAGETVGRGTGFRDRREGKKDMAYRLTVFIVNPDDEQVYVEHNFYGETKADAEHVRDEHLGSCAYFKAAEEEGRTVEEGEEIDEDERPQIE